MCSGFGFGVSVDGPPYSLRPETVWSGRNNYEKRARRLVPNKTLRSATMVFAYSGSRSKGPRPALPRVRLFEKSRPRRRPPVVPARPRRSHLWRPGAHETLARSRRARDIGVRGLRPSSPHPHRLTRKEAHRLFQSFQTFRLLFPVRVHRQAHTRGGPETPRDPSRLERLRTGHAPRAPRAPTPRATYTWSTCSWGSSSTSGRKRLSMAGRRWKA